MGRYFEQFRKRTIPIIREHGLINYMKRVQALLRTFLEYKYLSMKKNKLQDDFFKSYYLSKISASWLGKSIGKCPTDAWMYQEIIFKNKPDFIIETGTCEGGGTLFFASILDLIGKGKVITTDVEKFCSLNHPRIIQLTGSSASDEIIKKIESMVKNKNIMVSLDSNHAKDHVLKELEIYSNFVSVGNYMIVEDTCVNGHPVMPGWGPGPLEAVKEFLSKRDDFIIDKGCEKFMLSYNHNGFLKRVK